MWWMVAMCFLNQSFTTFTTSYVLISVSINLLCGKSQVNVFDYFKFNEDYYFHSLQNWPGKKICFDEHVDEQTSTVWDLNFFKHNYYALLYVCTALDSSSVTFRWFGAVLLSIESTSSIFYIQIETTKQNIILKLKLHRHGIW